MITQDVKDLLASIEVPGMKVLQFAFYGTTASTCLTTIPCARAVYTGTHDNDTARGWYGGLTDEERRRVWDYLGSDGREVEWALIRAAYGSVAETAIVPMQDALGLGSEARMNTPAAPANANWRWRARDDAFRGDVAERLRRMAALAGRLNLSSRA
jgi:4-alpha-glucanotransferase